MGAKGIIYSIVYYDKTGSLLNTATLKTYGVEFKPIIDFGGEKDASSTRAYLYARKASWSAMFVGLFGNNGIIARRKLFNPFKLIEFLACFVYLALDRLFLLGLKSKFNMTKNPIRCFFRLFVALPMALCYTAIQWVTSPINQVYRPLKNFLKGLWEYGALGLNPISGDRKLGRKLAIALAVTLLVVTVVAAVILGGGIPAVAAGIGWFAIPVVYGVFAFTASLLERLKTYFRDVKHIAQGGFSSEMEMVAMATSQTVQKYGPAPATPKASGPVDGAEAKKSSGAPVASSTGSVRASQIRNMKYTDAEAHLKSDPDGGYDNEITLPLVPDTDRDPLPVYKLKYAENLIDSPNRFANSNAVTWSWFNEDGLSQVCQAIREIPPASDSVISPGSDSSAVLSTSSAGSAIPVAAPPAPLITDLLTNSIFFQRESSLNKTLDRSSPQMGAGDGSQKLLVSGKAPPTYSGTNDAKGEAVIRDNIDTESLGTCEYTVKSYRARPAGG